MEKIKDILDGFSERIRSPYWSTFVLIWILCNWPIIYTIFYMDHNWPLPFQIETIRHTINKQGWKHLYLFPFVGTIISLIIYYLTSLLGLAIKEFYLARLKPWTLDIASQGAKIVSIERFNLQIRNLTIVKKEAADYKRMYFESHSDNESLRNEVEDYKKSVEGERGKYAELEDKHKSDQLKLRENIIQLDNVKSDLELLQLSKETLEDIFGDDVWMESTTIQTQVSTNTFKVKRNKIYYVDGKIYDVRDINTIQSGRFINFYKLAFDKVQTIQNIEMQKILEEHKNELIRINADSLIGVEDGHQISYTRIKSQVALL